MTRWFYTDPLATAWMAKHFGMKLLSEDMDGNPIDAGARFIDCDDTLRELWQHDFSYLGKLIVHPDSLHLLEPKPNDMVFYGYGVYPHSGEAWDEVKAIITPDDERYPTLGDGEAYMLLDGGNYRSVGRLNRIIQRHRKAFHWPESEAA